MSFEFGQPALLLLVLLAPMWWWWTRPTSLAGLLVVRGEVVDSFALAGWRERALELAPRIMRVTAIALLATAISQPRFVRVTEEPITEGVGVAFAVDLSTSMWAEDMAVRTTRLQAAKTIVRRFLAERGDDVGVVSFAGESLTRLPLTHDSYVVEMAVDAMEVGLLVDGTDVAGAIAAGAGLLKDQPHSSKVLILVTDGAHNKAGLIPALAARAAAAFDVKVYAIAIGDELTQGLAAVEMETVLTQAARTTGGRYFRANDIEALDEIYDEIDRLEMPSEVMTEQREPIPLGLWFLLAGTVLVLCTTTLRGSRWGVVP